jgi:uncharacterized ferritin-like protein (DUF455 family)
MSKKHPHQAMMRNVQAAALEALSACEVAQKLQLTHQLNANARSAETPFFSHPDKAKSLEEPGRPPLPKLVSPRDLEARKLGSVEGRAVLLHAVAHIEFNAINLALDAAYRFSDLPQAYYLEWLSVADDEARHFQQVSTRLEELGYCYGDFPAHNGLWEMALRTQHCLVDRMALVPRLLEARGLDVTPGMIERLKDVKDLSSAAVLELILKEEVGHVEIGTRWFRYACEQAQLPAEQTFLALLRQHAGGIVRPPFNHAARRIAGFTDAEMQGIAAL